MGYVDTFITVAEDCPVEAAVVPQPRGGKPTVAVIEHELLSERPYVWTQEEVLFETHVRHKGIADTELAARRDELREAFFAKSRACLRSSPLPKRFGWGLRFNAAGRIALYPMESADYRRLAAGGHGVTVLRAMRSRRA